MFEDRRALTPCLFIYLFIWLILADFLYFISRDEGQPISIFFSAWFFKFHAKKQQRKSFSLQLLCIMSVNTHIWTDSLPISWFVTTLTLIRVCLFETIIMSMRQSASAQRLDLLEGGNDSCVENTDNNAQKRVFATSTT